MPFRLLSDLPFAWECRAPILVYESSHWYQCAALCELVWMHCPVFTLLNLFRTPPSCFNDTKFWIYSKRPPRTSKKAVTTTKEPIKLPNSVFIQNLDSPEVTKSACASIYRGGRPPGKRGPRILLLFTHFLTKKALLNILGLSGTPPSPL